MGGQKEEKVFGHWSTFLKKEKKEEKKWLKNTLKWCGEWALFI